MVTDHLAMVSFQPGDKLDFGVKGMKWGIRNDSKGAGDKSKPKDPEATARRNAKIKKAALITAGVTAGVAVTAAAGYGGYKLYESNAGKKALKTTLDVATKPLQEPNDLIYATRGKHQGHQFLRTGGTPDYFSVFDSMGLNELNAGVEFVRQATDGTRKVAAQIQDPLGRTDVSSRPIQHHFVIPENMSGEIRTPLDVHEKIWPLVKDDYDQLYDRPRDLPRLFGHSDLMPSYLSHGLEGSSMPKDYLVQYRDEPADLLHFGIKGMKWGVRNDSKGGSSKGGAPVPALGPETSAQKYNRLAQQVKKQGGNSLDDSDLAFFNARGNAVAQAQRFVQRKPGRMEGIAVKAAESLAAEALKNVVKGASKWGANEAAQKAGQENYNEAAKFATKWMLGQGVNTAAKIF